MEKKSIYSYFVKSFVFGSMIVLIYCLSGCSDNMFDFELTMFSGVITEDLDTDGVKDIAVAEHTIGGASDKPILFV